MADEIIYDSEAQLLIHHKQHNILEQVWKAYTAHMSEDTYKEELSVYLHYFKELLPAHVIVDVRNLGYKVTPAVQIWTLNNIVAEVVEAGLQRQAFLVTEEFMFDHAFENNYSIEDEDDGVQIRYYDDESFARQWINREPA